MKLLVIITLALCAAVSAVDVPFSVEEPAGVARTAEPVVCGLAFKKGECTSANQLALFSGAAEVAAQFTPLVTFEDGSHQWVLVDFQDNFTSREIKSYTVKPQAPSATHASPITVGGTGTLVEINTGPLRFQVDTANFCGIRAAWVDGRQVLDGTAGGLTLQSQEAGQTFQNGPVTRAEFLYRGPLRVTLRVEGDFYRPSCGGVGYAFTITAWAGSRAVKVEVSIRNSINPTCGRLDKISRASLTLPLTFTPSVLSVSTVTYIKAFQDSAKGFFITDGWAGGYYPSTEYNIIPSGNNVRVDIIKPGITGNGYYGGVWYVYDLAHKNSEMVIDFYSGAKTLADLSMNRIKLMKSKLIGRPDPAYLSGTEALSAGRFGTLDNEIASYDKWGWSYSLSQTPRMGHSFLAAKESDQVHAETETDNGEGFLLQWIRTGSRGFFDEGEAWNRYYKTQYAFRSAGFEYDGQYDVASDILAAAVRTKQSVSNEPSIYGLQAASVVDISSYGGCHFYGAGLCDYYCLTGDRDALEAAVDLGEIVWTRRNRMGAGRGPGRQMHVLTRVYEAMRDSVWLARLNYCAGNMLSAEMDPRGFWNYHSGVSYFYSNTLQNKTGFPDSLLNYVTAHNVTVANTGGKIMVSSGGSSWELKSIFGSWEETYGQGALDRYFKATGNEDARDFVIGFAQHAATLAMSRCGLVPYILHFDYPFKNSHISRSFYNWDPAHDVCPGNYSTVSGTLPVHDGWYTVYYPGVCALGYRYTGFPYLMAKGKEFWNNGSKRGYQTTFYYTGPAEVYTFAYHKAPKDDGLLNTNALFYEAAVHTDTVPPGAIVDLAVTRTAANAGLAFTWTAPADNNGVPAEYQLKLYQDLPIVDYRDYDYATDDTAKVPWWRAQNVSGEPAPVGQGAPVGFIHPKSYPVSEVWYAAVRTRDVFGNLSPLSNVVRIDNTTPVESFSRAFPGVVMTAAPNPFNPAVAFRIGFDGRTGGSAVLSIFDAAGRLVKRFDIERPAPRAGAVTVRWRASDDAGIPAASGVYYAVLNSGKHTLTRKIVLVR